MSFDLGHVFVAEKEKYGNIFSFLFAIFFVSLSLSRWMCRGYIISLDAIHYTTLSTLFNVSHHLKKKKNQQITKLVDHLLIRRFQCKFILCHFFFQTVFLYYSRFRTHLSELENIYLITVYVDLYKATLIFIIRDNYNLNRNEFLFAILMSSYAICAQSRYFWQMQGVIAGLLFERRVKIALISRQLILLTERPKFLIFSQRICLRSL